MFEPKSRNCCRSHERVCDTRRFEAWKRATSIYLMIVGRCRYGDEEVSVFLIECDSNFQKLNEEEITSICSNDGQQPLGDDVVWSRTDPCRTSEGNFSRVSWWIMVLYSKAWVGLQDRKFFIKESALRLTMYFPGCTLRFMVWRRSVSLELNRELVVRKFVNNQSLINK